MYTFSASHLQIWTYGLPVFVYVFDQICRNSEKSAWTLSRIFYYAPIFEVKKYTKYTIARKPLSRLRFRRILFRIQKIYACPVISANACGTRVSHVYFPETKDIRLSGNQAENRLSNCTTSFAERSFVYFLKIKSIRAKRPCGAGLGTFDKKTVYLFEGKKYTLVQMLSTYITKIRRDNFSLWTDKFRSYHDTHERRTMIFIRRLLHWVSWSSIDRADSWGSCP